jgi:cell division protein FtsA
MLPGEEIIHVLPQEFKIDGQSEIKAYRDVWRKIRI